MISFSTDTTIKIWNMVNSDFSHPKVYYDHEGEILSADVCKNSIISIDENGIITIRNLSNPGQIESKIELNLHGEDGIDHAIIKFNKADPFTFFLVHNDALFVYESKSGKILNEISLDEDQEIDLIYQHKDCILIAQADGTIV